ncbi:O-antigen ligase family protein [Dactylosporangium sucinum]|uniref:O-antigen ligase family protein n=1 Tax=Dactylosporangium sucinum TaxID=1424081 RepID=UPI00167E8191|nr:O-antigen ligase family protein [Dactylosporangium sucinum]
MDSLALQRFPLIAVLAAATAGLVAQGGFYLPGRALVTALALAAAALAVREHLAAGKQAQVQEQPRRRTPWNRPTVLLAAAAGAVAAWALIRAATAGGWPTAAGVCVTLAVVVAAVAVTGRTRADERRSLADALVGLGVLVAVTAWAGVAWRIERWSVLVETKLWRGASTLTYPNAAAAVLAALALLALASLLADPGSTWRAVAAYLLLVGLGATLSRAGVLAFAAGALLLPFASAARAMLRHVAPAGLGAAVALAGLVPSFPAGGEPEPLPAVAALLIGGLLAVHLPRLHGRRLLAAWTSLLALAAGAVAFPASRPLPAQLDAIAVRRLTLDSMGREGALRSALDQVAAHPVLGTGPGLARFFWSDYEGKLVASRWVHNEYLQWLVDFGAVGLVLLGVLGAAVVVVLRRGRRSGAPHLLWTGAVAAIAALAVHSAFDFLWELAVVPLLFGVLVGMAGPLPGEEPAPSLTGEEQPQ